MSEQEEHTFVHGEGDGADHHYYLKGHQLVDTRGDVELTSSQIKHRSRLVDRDDICTNGDSTRGDNVFHDEYLSDHADDDDDDDDDDVTESHAIGSKRTPWYGTAIVLLSEVMGTGILSLPYAAKILGWAAVVAAVPLFALFASYSGWLLAQVQQQHQDGVELHSFADASVHLLGTWFGRFTRICMLLNWGATAIYYLIATADGIGDIFEGSVDLCVYQRTLLASLILVLPCQCRDFYAISKYLSGPSTCSIILMVFIVIGSLLSTRISGTTDTTIFDGGEEDYSNTTDTSLFPWDASNATATSTPIYNDTSTSNAPATVSTITNTTLTVFGETTTLGPLEGTTVLDYLQALSAFVFAYQGHAIFLELMTEMKDAKQFPTYSCGAAYAFMAVMYGMTIIVAYGIRGVQTEEFLPDILPAGAARKIVGVLVCLHISVSYVIAGQPLHMWMHATFFPKTYNQESRKASFHWFLLTGGYILFGFFIGNLIPFFADVQALIGSLFGAPTMFGWPVAFYLSVSRRKSTSWCAAFHSIGIGHATICLFFLLICTPMFCLLGTTGAITSIVQDSEHEAERPFQCN